MPLSHALSRRIVASSIPLTVLSLTASARADEQRCVRGAAVGIEVEPSPEDPTLGRRILEQMFSEVSPSSDETCTVGKGAPPPPRSSVRVRWLAPLRARVVIEVKTGAKDYEATRDIDLQAIPDDGRPLALGIAAAEMLDALNERAVADAQAQPPAPAPPPPERAKIVVVPVATPPPLRAVGSLMAIEHFTSGLTLLGPDLRLGLPLSHAIDVTFRAGVRSPSLSQLTESELKLGVVYVTGIGGHIGTPQTGKRGLAATLGADAVWLTSTVPGASGGTGLVGHVGMAVWESLGGRVRFVFDVTVGAELMRTHLAGSSGVRHAVFAGAAVGAGMGIVSAF